MIIIFFYFDIKNVIKFIFVVVHLPSHDTLNMMDHCRFSSDLSLLLMFFNLSFTFTFINLYSILLFNFNFLCFGLILQVCMIDYTK